MVTGASVANFVQSLLTKRDDGTGRSLIDFDASLLLQPLALGGTVIGFLLNQAMPDWLILTLLVIVLIISTYRTLKKGIQLYKKEIKGEKEKETEMEEQNSTVDEEVLTKFVNDNENSENQSLESTIEENSQVQQIKTKVPWVKIVVMVAILILITGHSLIIGGKSGVSLVGIKVCSVAYWIILILLFPVLIVFTICIGIYLHKTYVKLVKSGFNFIEGDIAWTKKRVVFVSTISILAGIVASLLGLGGGMVIGPILVCA